MRVNTYYILYNMCNVQIEMLSVNKMLSETLENQASGMYGLNLHDLNPGPWIMQSNKRLNLKINTID